MSCMQTASQVIENYNKHIYPVLGPLIGHASDGDTRRRKLHLQQSLSRDGDRYRLASANFSMSGKIVHVNGQKILCDLSDQDFVHCGKKLINHLKHSSRVLSIGGNVVMWLICITSSLYLIDLAGWNMACSSRISIEKIA